ncbi:MAG: hypothetical protein HY007_02330 [Candidatus Sungbacteria bacterium]|nr:hypothetical protein [Candidatus Sungbacteria bacterium]
MFSDSQLKLIAETLANVGLAFFAAMVIPPFLSTEIDVAVALAGFFLAAATWIISLFIIKNITS